jgi:hypothetical protein
VAFWFFEYWINRWVGEELLEVLGADPRACRGFVAVGFKGGDPAPWASASGRVIALHGTGRFVAQGWFERKDSLSGMTPREHAFTTYGLVELFQVLAARLQSGMDFAHDVRRRVHLYFTLINILLVAAAVGLFLWHLNWSRPLAVDPMVRASAIKPDVVTKAERQALALATGDALAHRLLLQSAEQRPSLVVAASGGIWTSSAFSPAARSATFSATAATSTSSIQGSPWAALFNRRSSITNSAIGGGWPSTAAGSSRAQVPLKTPSSLHPPSISL